MKTLFCLLLCCLTITIYANDLSLKIDSSSLSENQELKAGQDYSLNVSMTREDDDTNSVPLVIYYKWNNDTPSQIFKGSHTTEIGGVSRNIHVPDLAGQSAILKVYLVSNLDTFASNDTVIINCQIVERYLYDLKITLIKPASKTNITAGKPYSFQFNILNEGTKTFRKGEIFQFHANVDTVSLTREIPHVDYLGEDLKTGDSTTFKYSVPIPEYVVLREAELCATLNWVEYEEKLNYYRRVENDGKSHYFCLRVNTIGLSQEKPEANIRPQLNLRNQQLSFATQVPYLPYNSIQVFNLSGKLLMSNSVVGDKQKWYLPTSESTVVVLLSGPKESHRQLLVNQ